MDRVAYTDIHRARQLLSGVSVHTDVVLSETLTRVVGCQVYLKTENRQRTGSFKIRGAYVRIAGLTEKERAAGVITASAGNHAQGVAIAAHAAGIKSVIVMPEMAPLSKIMAARSYGAEVVLSGSTYDDASRLSLQLQAELGATYVHPFDDPRVIAGQGTIGIEILEDLPDVDAVLVPVGGGGLIAGVATAIRHSRQDIKIIGVQAASAPACCESFRSGRLHSMPVVATIADGIAVKRPGDLPFSIIKESVDDVVTVGDEEISQAIVFLLERTKLLVEGAGAVGVAALMAKRVSLPGKKVLAILSGGNVDINAVARIIEHGLTTAGRYLVVRTRLLDQPGQVFALLRVLAEQKVNVLDIQHYRIGFSLPLNQAEVLVTVETRDSVHGEEIVKALTAAGFNSEKAS